MSQHRLSCHCGAVSLTADVSLDAPVTCNCSICGRTGALMAFVPFSSLTDIRGEEHLTDYQFGKKTIHHVFCSICGCRPFARGIAPDGSPSAMINLRCVEGLDVHAVEVGHKYDGRAL